MTAYGAIVGSWPPGRVPPDSRVRRTRSSRGRLGGFVVVICLVATPGWGAEMRQPEAVTTSSGSRPLSPAVVATWVVRKEPRGSAELELLVLWRGNPGWFMRAGSNGSSGSVSSQSAGNENDRGIVVEQLSFGGIRLDLEFDRSKRTARVQDHEVSLESANVILVDDVDGASGPQIAGSLQVDALFPDDPDIEMIIRDNAGLYSYLRCDAKIPDANAQEMIDVICARMKEN